MPKAKKPKPIQEQAGHKQKETIPKAKRCYNMAEYQAGSEFS